MNDNEWYEDGLFEAQGELPFEEQIPDPQETISARSWDGNPDLFDQGAAMSMYQIPTATTNPMRPRTVAAKYAPEEDAIYVVMRPYMSHGALKTPVVRYEPCSALDWMNFRKAYSKGQFIYQNWDPTKDWAEVSGYGLDADIVAFVQYAQAQQKLREGIQYGQSTASRKYRDLQKVVRSGGKVTQVRSDKLGGSTRGKNKPASNPRAVRSAQLDAALDAFRRNHR